MRLTTILALLAVLLLMVGCGNDNPIRWQASEPTKASADAVHRAAAELVASGAAPYDPALIELRNLSGPPSGYIGQPKETLDIEPILKASRNKWNVKEAQNAALELKVRWSRQVAQMQSRFMANLAERYAKGKDGGVGKRISKQELVDDVALLQGFVEEALLLDDEIEVPEMPRTTNEMLEDLVEAQKASKRIAAAAQKTAALRPDAMDVADEATRQADSWIGWVQENPLVSAGITALGGGPLLAGVGMYRSKKRRIREVADATKSAEEKAAAERLREAEVRAALLTPVPGAGTPQA